MRRGRPPFIAQGGVAAKKAQMEGGVGATLPRGVPGWEAVQIRLPQVLLPLAG